MIDDKKTKIKGSKKIIVLVTIAVLIIVGIMVLVAIYPFRNNDISDENRLPIIDLDDSQGEYQAPVQPYQRNIVLPGWISLTIPANTTDINSGIDFYNPKDNLWNECSKCRYPLDDAYKCTNTKCNEQYDEVSATSNCFYMTFALYLTNNDECLYQSKLVEPNKHIQHISLSRPLDEGEYSAYVFIQPYMSDMKTPCNNGRVDIKLIVK